MTAHSAQTLCRRLPLPSLQTPGERPDPKRSQGSALSLAVPRAPLALERTRLSSGVLTPAGRCDPERQPRQRPRGRSGQATTQPRLAQRSGPGRRTPPLRTHLEPSMVGVGMRGRGRGHPEACRQGPGRWASGQRAAGSKRGRRAPGRRGWTTSCWAGSTESGCGSGSACGAWVEGTAARGPPVCPKRSLCLPVGESNPGLPRDRRGYSPLY